MKKFILLMLTITLAALPVLSCAGDGGGHPHSPAETGEPGTEPGTAGEIAGENEGANEAANEAAEELAFPDLPDVNFEDYNFRIINTAAGALPHILTQLAAETETGEALNDAIFRRNRRMEERFGFNIVMIDVARPSEVQSRARTSIQAGSDDFDLALMNPEQALSLAQAGMLEMIDRIPYIDLSAPWWDQDMTRDYSIGNRVFLTISDFSFSQYSVTVATMFNKQLHADLGLDCPYQLVREGRWTLERFAEMGRQGMRDLDGNNLFDHNDQWGFVAAPSVFVPAFLFGAGARYVVKDADDLPVLNLNTEGFISRFHAVFDMVSEGWHFNPQPPPPEGIGELIQDMFLNGRALFWTEFLNRATFLRAMDNDFGILPQPKLNEQQEYYISATALPNVMSIPVTTLNLERTGIILEALSAESRLTALDVYFDTMLVNQILNRDEESGEMLDIIFANRVYDLGRQFWPGSIANPIADAMRDGNRDIVSLVEAREPVANAAIETTISAFLDN